LLRISDWFLFFVPVVTGYCVDQSEILDSDLKVSSVALNFCGSLILQMGDFLCFGGTNFAIGRNWFFLLGINFLHFQEVAFYLELQHSRLLSKKTIE